MGVKTIIAFHAGRGYCQSKALINHSVLTNPKVPRTQSLSPFNRRWPILLLLRQTSCSSFLICGEDVVQGVGTAVEDVEFITLENAMGVAFSDLFIGVLPQSTHTHECYWTRRLEFILEASLVCFGCIGGDLT